MNIDVIRISVDIQRVHHAIADLIGQRADGSLIKFGRATSSERSQTPNLLTQVDTSQGESIEVTYGSTTTNSLHETVVSERGVKKAGDVSSSLAAELAEYGAGQVARGDQSAVQFAGVQQVVSKIIRRNGRGQTRPYRFEYGQSYWVPELRRFSGFEWVRTKLPPNPGLDYVYIQTIFDVTAVGLGNVLSIERFATPKIESATHNSLSYDVTNWERSTVGQLPLRAVRANTAHEVNVTGQLNATTLANRVNYTTNLFGQTTETVEHGYTGGLAADRYTCLAYATNLSAYIVNTPRMKWVQDTPCGASDNRTIAAANTALWERYFYDQHAGNADNPSRGNLTKLERWMGLHMETLATRIYDSDGNVTTETDANQNDTIYTYGGPGNMFRLTSANAKGHTTTTTWNEACQSPATVTDPNALTTTYGYDAFCRETTQSHTSGAYKNTSYNLFGSAQTQFVEVTSPSPSGGIMSVRSYFDGFGQTYRA